MKVRSATRPQDIEITATSVLVASNITPYEEEFDGRILRGYEYECTTYTKDEFLLRQQAQLSALAEEPTAAKILLGVD